MLFWLLSFPLHVTLGIKSICCLLLRINLEECGTSNQEEWQCFWWIEDCQSGIATCYAWNGFVLTTLKSFSWLLKGLNYGPLYARGRSCYFIVSQMEIKFWPLCARKTDREFFHQNSFSLEVKWIFKNKPVLGSFCSPEKILQFWFWRKILF